MGSEFINFKASIATCWQSATSREAGLLNRMCYKDLIDDQHSAWRIVDSLTLPRYDNGF